MSKTFFPDVFFTPGNLTCHIFCPIAIILITVRYIHFLPTLLFKCDNPSLNPLKLKTFYRQFFEIYPKIGSHRLPIHKCDAHRKFFHGPFFFLNENFNCTVTNVNIRRKRVKVAIAYRYVKVIIWRLRNVELRNLWWEYYPYITVIIRKS